MGGLNSGPGPGITLLIAFVLVLCSNVLSAPLYEEDDTQDSNGQGLIEPQGCYYNFQHYNEGERILTNEPCLNCTCRNRMLMCYLRVCPFTKGIGQNCTVEKVPGQCCPIITCPEVPVQLLTSSTTEHSESDGRRPDLHHGIKGTAVGHLDNSGCQIDGVFYPNGAQVPGSPEKPCELCYCIRNKTACIMQSCALHVDGCRPIYEDGQCFPVRYQCDDQPYEDETTTTIRPAPTPGLIITTTSSEPLECYYNNEIYEDGSRIQTEDPCEHCYCLKGKIACAVQECGAPLEKEGQNCTALPPAPGKCCPDSYQCDITMSSQKFGQGSEGTTPAGFSSVEDAGHPTDGHYPGEHGVTKTTEKPKYGSQNGEVTEGLTLEAVTPSKGVSGKPPVSSDGQRPHLDKGQPGSQDSTDLEHHEELNKGTQLPIKHQDSLPNEYMETPEDVTGQQKITSADGTKPGVTKRPVYGTKPEMESSSSSFPTMPGSLNEFVQRQNQSQTDPISTVQHPANKDKPYGQKPEQYGDKKAPVSGSKPQESSSSDGTKVQDGIQTTHGSGQPTTKPEHILHVMEQQKPAPGIESHVQDTSSTQWPFNEGLSTLNAFSTEKTGSTKPSYGGHWKPQPGIYQPDLQGTPFDVSQEEMSPDRTKPVFSGSDKLPEDNYGYSTPIPAIDEDQNVKGQMNVSNAKDQLIDKLHNIIQDVQAQVNDGKTTEMPEEADYKTTTQSQKGHFTEKLDTLPHLHPGSQDSHHPLGSGHGVPTTKPTSDKETQSGNAVTDIPKDTSDIFNKIQGIIHGMFTQVTEAVQTTLAPLTAEDVDGKKPSKDDEESSSAKPEHKPDTTHELKPTDGPSTYPQGTKPTDSYKHPVKVGSTGAPNDSHQRPQGSGSYYPQGSSKYPGSTHTRYPDGSKPEDSEYPSITQYPDYISPDGETGDFGKNPEGPRPGNKPYGSGKYPEGSKPGTYPHGTEYPEEVGSTIEPEEHDSKTKPVNKVHGTKYPTEHSEDPSVTNYPDNQTTNSHQNKYPEGFKPSAGKPHQDEKYPQGTTTTTGSHKYPLETEHLGVGVTGRPQGDNKYPLGTKPSGSEKYPQSTEYPDKIASTMTPDGFEKYPDGSSSVKGSDKVKFPEQIASTGKPHYSTKYPGSKYPEEFTDKTSGSEDQPYGTEYPDQVSLNGKPQDFGKYPEGSKPTPSQEYSHYPHGTEHPGEVESTVTPDEFGKYPDGTSPVKGSEGVKDPSEIGSSGRPHYSTKYPGSKYPEGFTGKPIGSEHEPYGPEYSEGVGSTGTPQDLSKYPEGFKPTTSQKHPHFPQGTEYPDEVGSTVTPDEFGKYPDETTPVKGSENVKYPGQSGSTGRPHYSTKYPGSKYPEGITGKPTDLEDESYGTENPEEFGITGRPHSTGKYPEGMKPTHTDSGSPYDSKYPEVETGTDKPYDSNKYPEEFKPAPQKLPQYPLGTEYPDEVGSTVTPDEFGKYPDGTGSVKGSQGVKYPGQAGSTVRPHYSTKYPGSKYPEGITGKPTGSEDVPHDTEYPEEDGVTGRPQPVNKYPFGTKPPGFQKHPYGTEYPDLVGSTITPDEFGKYPYSTSTVKGSEGVKYPGESGSTSSPLNLSKYPEGTKPSGSQKYPHGTEYPDDVGSTVTPDEFGKYPDGIIPVKGSDVKYPGQTDSTGRPHYSTKYPGSKYPEEITGKPSGSEDEPYGTKYPEGVGVTGRPQGGGKYPEKVKPTHSHSERPYGTEYPERESGTDRPYDSNKYSEESKPIRGPGGVLYPDETGSTSRPQVEDQYLEGTRPNESEGHPSGSEYPNKESVTDSPYGANNHPAGFKPSQKYPGGSYPTGTELPEYSTAYPNENDFNGTPGVSGKYPHGSKPAGGIYQPDSIEYPDHTDTPGQPHYPGKYPDGFDPAQKPQGSTQHFGRPTEKPFGTEEYPYHTEYPEGFTGKPDDLSGSPRPVRPGYRPQDSKHPTDSSFDSTRFPVGSRPTFRPKYPESSTQIRDQDNLYETQSPYEPGVTSRPQTTGKYPSDVSKYPDDSKPAFSGKHPEIGDSKKPQDSQTDYPEGVKPSDSPQVTSKYPEGLTDKPYDLSKYPEESRPSDKYPFGTDYPEGVGSTVTPDKFGKYPDETGPVKGEEGLKHPDQTESTERPHYPDKYPGSKIPEGMTGKPTDSEDEPYGTKYPEGVVVTRRPQGTEKYPEGVKPTHSDSERPYGNEYPEGETETNRPYGPSKYPDGTKPEEVNYHGQTGPTETPHYSTKYPGSKFPEGVTGTEQEPHPTKYPEDLGKTGRPEYSEKYPEKNKPVGKPDELGKYPDEAKPSDLNQLPEGEGPGKQPEDEESGTGRPYGSTKYPEGYRPNDKYPEGLKPIDLQESTKLPDDGSSPESVTDHQYEVESTDRAPTDRPGSIKHPEGIKPTDDPQDSDKHPDESKPTNKDEFTPETNVSSDQKKDGKPGEEGLKPEQSEKSPEDPENVNKLGVTDKPDDSSKHTTGAQTTSSDKYPHSTKYQDKAGSTTEPDEFGKHPEQYESDGKPDDTSKLPEDMAPEDFVKYPHGAKHPTEEADKVTDSSYDPTKYLEGTKPVRGPEGVKYPEQIGSTGRPHYPTKYPGSKYPEGFTGKPSNSEDQPHGTEYPDEEGKTGRPQDHSKYPEGFKPTSQKRPQYPYGTEYPDEVGSTVTPDELGKYPDGTNPMKGSGGVKYPHSTEYSEEETVTDSPYDPSKYPEGTKPVRGPDEAKDPGQTGSTGKPHYSTKYPASKYPEGFTGKPTDSQNEPHGTEYPGVGLTGKPQGEEFGSTDRPQDLNKHPEGTKPSSSQKYPHGTEYPDEIGSSVTPDEFGKYPDGTTSVEGSEGVKYPTQTESTVRPHYSTKYPGSKYPEGFTGKPTDTEDQPYSTEYPEGIGVTGRPQGSGKYPERVKPTHSESEGDTETDRPYDSSKYPEETKPVREPDGVKYPGQTGSTGRPLYPDGHTPTYGPEDTNKLSESVKPTDSDESSYTTSQPHETGVYHRPGAGSRPNDKFPLGSQTGSDEEAHTTEFPEGFTGTSKPHDLNKYPEGAQPTITGHGPEEGKYPEFTKVGEKPKDPSKHPQGTRPEDAEHYPHGTEYPDYGGSTTKPYDPNEYPKKSTSLSHVTKRPDEETGAVGPFDSTKHPDGSRPLHSTKYPGESQPTEQAQDLSKGTDSTKYPGYIGTTLLPHVTSKYPGDKMTSGKPEDSNKLPEDITQPLKKPGAEGDQSMNEYPNEILGTDKPLDSTEHSGHFIPHYTTKRPAGIVPPDLESMSHSTKHPHEPDRKPDDFEKHSGEKEPVHEPEGVTYPGQTVSPGAPHYPTKYPGSHRPTGKPQNLLPEGFTSAAADSDNRPHGTEPTDVIGVTGGPQDLSKNPEENKPTPSQKHPHYPHVSEYPDEVGSTATPDELGQYPDGISPVKGSEGVKDPSEIGSSGRPHYSTKYPGSKYPEGFTGKPIGSEHEPYGPEYSEGVGSTGTPQDLSKYPEGFKPTTSQKHPHFPQGTEYPDEVGSTVTPDEFGKYPDETTPVKGSENVKYPGQSGSTGRPHYSTKYPGSKYPEGITGKPTDLEDESYGTENPEEFGITGRPHSTGKYPEGMKPTHTDSGSPYDSKYPEVEIGTDKPYDSNKYPEEFKPTPQKHPQYPLGTEYPDEVGSTVTPDEFGKYPDGTGTVKGSQGVKYPGQAGSTVRPHYSTKYPGSKYPEGITGKPTGSDDVPYGTEYPGSVEVTRGPQGTGKYPEEAKPTHSHSERPYGTEYPEGETGTDKPYNSNEYPEGTKPALEPEGGKYPGHSSSTGRPHYPDEGTPNKPHGTGSYLEGVKPTDKHPDYNRVTDIPFDTSKFPDGSKPEDLEEHTSITKRPDGIMGTTKLHDSGKYPEGVQPSTSGYDVNEGNSPGFTKVTEKPDDATKYPEVTKPSHSQESGEDTDRPHDKNKHPEGAGSGHPDVSKYPSGAKDTNELGSTIKPVSDGKHPVVFKPTDQGRPSDDLHPEEEAESDDHTKITEIPEVIDVTGKPDGSNKFPEGLILTGRPHYTGNYPEGAKPTDSIISSSGTEYPGQGGSSKYPDGFRPTTTLYDSSKYPEGVTPTLSEKDPEDFGGSRITVRPDGITEYPDGYTGKPHYTDSYPEGLKPTDSDDIPHGTEYPGKIGSGKYPTKIRPGVKPHDSEKYPESGKPTYSDKYPHGTEYHNEIGSTVTPNDYGKLPDGTSPVKGPEGVKYPTGSTGEPHYSTKYPESKYPEGFTGKPSDTEDQPYDTEYPGVGATGRPQNVGKYPEKTEPSESYKHPHLPYGTEYPDEVGSTVTPEKFEKYPDGSSPVKGSEGVKYPEHIGSTGRPHYTTKYPASKYPEGFTSKPTGSEDVPHGSEYPGVGITNRPQGTAKYPEEAKPTERPYGTEFPEGEAGTGRPYDSSKYPDLSKHPEGTKPSSSQKYPHGTEYPDEIGSSVTPDEFGKYPNGISSVKGSEGVKDPSAIGSTGRPHYSTEYPGSKYPEGFTGKPTDSENQPYGTEYPESVGLTDKPQGSGKYPERVNPTHSDSERPYSTQYPEREGVTYRPYDTSKYPEGSKPVRGPDGVKNPSEIGSTGRPQGVGEYPEEEKPVTEDKYPDGVKPTTSKDSSYGTQYPDVTGDSLLDTSSSTSGTSAYDSVSKQPGSMYLPLFPQTGEPFSSADDKDKPLELPEESVKPGHDGYGSSTPKGSESDGQKVKPEVPVSVSEMDVTTHSPDEYPKRPDSADLTHDPEYKPQPGEHDSKHPSETSSTQIPDSNLNAQYPSTKEPSTDLDGKVAPQDAKTPQGDLLTTRPGFETPYTEKTSPGVSTPKHGSSKTERPVQGLPGHDKSTTDQYETPIKHADDEHDSTSPSSVDKYSESSDEYSTTEYSPQNEITGKPIGTRPAEHPSRPDQKDVYTTKQPSEGRPTHGVGHPEDISPGSEGFDGSVQETTTVDNDDLINKLQSIIYGIQTQVTNDKTTRQPSTSDLNAPFGQSTEMPYESVIGDRRTTPSSHHRPSSSNDSDEQKPQDHSEQPHESVEYATDKPYVTGDKRQPIGFDGTRPHGTDKPLAGSDDDYTTALGEETTEGYLEKENEIHDPEGHLGKKPQSTKKPSFGSSTEFSEMDRPTYTKHPDGVSGQHLDSTDTESSSRPTEDKDKPTSLTDEYPEEGKRPDEVQASEEKMTGKPDDSMHFPHEKPSSPTSESSTPGISDEHTPTRKTGSTQVGFGDDSSTPSYDSEKPEGSDSSTKQPETHHDTETKDHVGDTSSTPKDGVLGVTKTPETNGQPQKDVTKPDDRPGGPHGEENVPVYHGVESVEGKPTDQPDSMFGENHTVLPEENSTGTKKPLKTIEKPSHVVPVDEETGQVTESGETIDPHDHKHPSYHEPTNKPLHVVYPTYYPDGIITRKPGSRPQDTGNKVTVTPQSNVYGTSTPSKEGDDTTQSVSDKESMRPTVTVPADGSYVSTDEPVTEGLFTIGSTKGAVPQEGFTTDDVTGKPHAPADKHPDSSVDDTQSSGESGTTSPVIIIEEVHTEVHSERATTKPGTESYDQTTKSITSVYPDGFDESLTKKPGTFDGKTTKKPDLLSYGTESVFQEGKPGYKSTVQPVSTDRPQDSLHHTSQPGYGSSVPVSGVTESHPDVLAESTTDKSLQQGTGKPAYQTKYPESLDGKSTNEPGLVIDGTTPSSAQSGEPGSQYIMNLYSPKDKYSTTTSPEHKETKQPGSFTTGSRVPGETDEGSLYTTFRPDDSHQGPAFDHEIFESKFPGRKTTQKPLVTPEAQPDFTTVFEVGTTSEPQEGVTSTQTQGTKVEHHVPSFIFPQKQPEDGVTSTEGYITQGRPLSTVGQPGVIFEGKQTTPSYQFVTSGTYDLETSTKKPFQPSVKGASYVPYRIIDGRKVYYPEREVSHKPNESDKHGFDGFDYMPYEIINGKKFFKPNEAVSQPTPTSTTPKHRLGMYVPYKIINGTKVYYTEDPQGKPQPGVEDYDGLDYVPFDIINGTKVFYPEAVKDPTSPASHETTTTPSYIMAMYVPYKIINGTKVYYPEDSPNKPESEDYDGLDYVPFEIVNGKKVFYPERVTTPPKGTSTPSYVMAMYVPYKITNGTKVYYPEDPQGNSQTENYDGLDYVPFEIVNGTKVFYPERVTPIPEATTKPAHVMAMYVPYKIVNGTKVYFPEEPQVGSEEYDGLDYVPFEIVNGTKVFYPERASTTSYGSTTTPSYLSAMYVPYKIVDGRKVYYPKYAQYKPYKVPESFAGVDYIPYELINGSKVFYPDRITTLPPTVSPTKHHQGLYLPYKIVNGTKIYYPKDAEEKPQGVLDGYDGSDYVPYDIVNGTKVFYPEKTTTERPGVKAMYVPYKIVNGTKVYYPKDAQPTLNLIPEGYEGFDFVPYDIVNGTKIFYPEKTTTERPGVKAMYVPYKIVNGTKVYYPKDAQPTPNLIPEGYEGFDFVPYDIVNGTKVFYPEKTTTERPGVKAMYVPYKIVNGTKVYYPKDAQPTPNLIPEGYEGFDFVPYDIENGMKVFYPERVTTPAPNELYYMQGMYVPYKIVDGRKVYYPQRAQHNPVHVPEGYEGFDYLLYDIVNGTKVFHPERGTASPTPTHAPSGTFYPQGMYVPFRVINGTKVFYPQDAQHNPVHIPEGYEGSDYLPYDIVNGTKVFHPERVTSSPSPTHAPSGTFYPQGMYVPFRVINGTKVFYPQDAQHRPDPMKNDYDGWQHLPYDIVNGTKVFYPERVTTEVPIDQMSAMYIPFKMINGTKVFYANDAQYQPFLIPEGYDGFEYVPYEIINGTKMFYPDRATPTLVHFPTTARPVKQGMFVPYKIINGAKVYYPKHATDSPRLPSSEYNGVDFIPYEVINGTKVFYPDRIHGPELETSGTQAMYVPYKFVNGTKVFYPKDAQFKPYLIPEGYDGFDYLPYEVKNGTKVFYPERVTVTVTQRPEQVPSQGMFVPYKMINGQKVYYPKEAQKRPHPLSSEYDGLDYIPFEVVNGSKVFYPEYVSQSVDMSGTPMSQAMYVPYKIINGTKVFYPKYAQHKPHLVPGGYDGFEYIPYKIVNGTKFFYPDRVATQPHKVQGMYVPYKIINGTKVFYPKYAQPTLQQLPKGFDGIDYIPYEMVNGTKVFYPEKATPSGVSGTPVVQALYVPYKIINGKKVFYPKNAVERPQTIPEGYDGFAYMPYSIVNGTKMFYPEQAQFPGVNKVPSLQGTFVPYKLLNSTKVFYPKYANDESPRVPDGYDGVDYVPYESVNSTKVFYPELISLQASSGSSPVPGKYVPYKVVNGKKVFYPKEGKPQYPSGGVRYPYDGIVYVPYKDLSGTTSPSIPGNYPPFVTPEHSLYGQNSEIVYVDDDDESFRPQFISQNRPSQEQTGSHIGHVPGEGSCFLNNMTYENNMEIQPVSTCQSRCRCINSIVRCVRIKCPPLPQSNTANCSPVYDEGSCCPTYSCENDDLDYLTTTEYPGSQDSSEYPEMVLTGSSSTIISFDSTTQFAVTDESPHKPLYGQDGAGDLSGGKPHPSRKPITSDGQHPTDQYHIHRPQKPKPSEQGSLEPYDGVEGHPMTGEFSGEDDYDGEDEEPYGPGTCRYAGKVYVSAQQIPRDDPCDFCFCFRSDIICLQQSCPPPIPGCRDEPIQGFCCPRYECHVKMATLLNVTSTTTTTTTTLPPHFFLHPYKGSATRTGCFVQGKAYRVGQAIPSASGPCMDCICRGNGRMECEPKVCTPEPMIRKMIVPAENTTSPSSER